MVIYINTKYNEKGILDFKDARFGDNVIAYRIVKYKKMLTEILKYYHKRGVVISKFKFIDVVNAKARNTGAAAHLGYEVRYINHYKDLKSLNGNEPKHKAYKKELAYNIIMIAVNNLSWHHIEDLMLEWKNNQEERERWGVEKWTQNN